MSWQRADGSAVQTMPAPSSTVADAIGGAAATPSWYLANFVPTAGQQGSGERRTARYALRALNRQEGVSALDRPARCGLPIGGGLVAVHRQPQGACHTSGIETCASIWACPVCAAKIRNYRAGEIADALGRHVAGGGGALLVTLTLPHQAGDQLRKTVGLVSDGFRALQRGRAYAAERSAYSILGHIRAFEVTHGRNGWHPHLHLIMVTAAPFSDDQAAALQSSWQARWDRWLRSQGWPASLDGIGVRVDRVKRDAAAVGEYVAKVQEGDADRFVRGAALEATRADLKAGRGGSRVPFQVLADFGCDGAAADLALWHEYQTATKGRSAIRWSRGLRDLLAAPELTDEEVAELDAGGDVVLVLTGALYRTIAARPYGEAMLMIAAEAGGYAGVTRFVRALQLDVRGVLPPEALKGIDQRGAA